MLFNLSIESINYYISIIVKDHISVRELESKIKLKEYERLPLETKNKIYLKDKLNVQNLVKDPIVLNGSGNYINLSEKVLQKIILEDIPSF